MKKKKYNSTTYVQKKKKVNWITLGKKHSQLNEVWNNGKKLNYGQKKMKHTKD
jgi:hypothetical protein